MRILLSTLRAARRLLLAIACVIPALAGSQGVNGATPLPFDSKIITGTLPNGMRYYVRKNAKPEKRAELRLVVNAGSILEDDDQLGYAHFIEHMAFNGTTHFPKNEIVSYLQSIGLRFGADLNASTSFDETVYKLQIPTDTARQVDRAFEILGDWAHEQLFDSAEVVRERGVVLEEWRSGRGADERMERQALPIILRGSRYADRTPIGTDKSIMAATPGILRRFYQQWYRPDLMAVVAVGDFDPAEIVKLIEQHLGGIPAPANPRERPTATIPTNAAPLISIATDKEATGTFVEVGFKRTHAPLKTVDDYRRSLIERMYLTLINNRLYELTQKPKAPFSGAGMSLGGFFARNLDAFTIEASVKDGGIELGLETVLTEVRRVNQFGFLPSEFDRAKANLLRSYERSFAERETQPHGTYVGACVSAFLDGTTPLDIEYTYPLAQQLVPAITLAEVNGLAAKWITDDNRVIMTEAPAKAGVKIPSDRELLAVFDKAAKARVTAYTENVSDAPLLTSPPAPGHVVRERTIDDVGVTEWTLSNGARVLLKPTDFKADEILLAGSSEGGTSLVSDDDYLSASLASVIASLGGAGRYNAIDLGKKLNGKAVRAAAGVTDYGQVVSATASPRDLETMFQLLYLRLTEPRLDRDAWSAAKDRVLTAIADRGADPASVFSDTIDVTMSQNDVRSRPLTARMLDQVNLTHALEFYRDRFADMGDFTFAIVGNIKPEVLKPLVEQYLASLPGRGRGDHWKDVTKPPPTGVIEKTVRKGVERKSETEFVFTGSFTSTADNRFALGALMAVVQLRLNETLRQQLGGTYSPHASGEGSRIPREQYSINIGYESAPENVGKLAASVLAIIDTLSSRGPSQADVDKVREQFTRGRETVSKTNAFWLAAMASREERIDSLAARLSDYGARVKSMSVAQIQAAAKQYFNTQNYVRFILMPAADK